MGKLRKFIFGILSFIIVVPLVTVGGIAIYDSIRFSDYYGSAEKLYKIPGINDNYIPQGLAYSKDYKVFLNAGYMKDNSASRVYITNEDDSTSKYVSLKYEGELFKKHNGGIAVHGEYAYISTAKKLYKLSMKELTNANNGDYINIISDQDVHTNSSFCFASETMMYVGEYYDGKDYITDDSHKFTSGEQTNHALILAYPFLGDTVLPLPTYGYSILNNAQGMCITSTGKIVISTSSGINPSKLISYETNLETTISTLSITDLALPISISFLGTNELVNEITCPAMNEELEYKDGYIYINNESACNKYIFGKFTKAKYIYRIKMD